MTHGQACVEAIRSHLARTGKKWSQLRGEDVAEIIDRVDADRPAEEKKRRARKRDLVFEALAESCGANVAEMTAISRGSYNRALQAIRDACRDLTDEALAEQVTARAALYRRKNPTWPLTPPALAKHWPELNGAKVAAKRQPDQPDDWEDEFIRENPLWSRDPERRGVVFGDIARTWATLPPKERNALLERVG